MPAASGSGGTLHANPAVLHVAARSMTVASTQLLSMAAPAVIAPAGADQTSIAAATRLNVRSAMLVAAIDEASWVLAGGATEVMNTANSLAAKDASNAAAYFGTSVPDEAAAAGAPTFPAPPVMPSMSIPTVPGLPEAVDAEWHSRLINGGAGADQVHAAAQHWKNTGQQLVQVADVIDEARRGMQQGWESQNAEVGHAAFARFSSWMRELGHGATQHGQDHETHANNFTRVRDKIVTPDQAVEAKNNWVDAVNENANNGGLSTGKVFAATNEITKQNGDATTHTADYSAQESGSTPAPDPGGPPGISSNNPVRGPGPARPAPGTLKDRLARDPLLGGLDDKLGKGMQDPKQMMSAMMAAVGGLGAVGGLSKGLTQPFQGLQNFAQQGASQLQNLIKPQNTNGIKPPSSPLKSSGSGAGAKKAGGGGGGGTKPAGLGGVRSAPPTSPSSVPATSLAPRATVPTGGTGGPALGMTGGGGMGMAPAGAGGAGKRDDKARARNKDLFPDEEHFADDTPHAPAVYGALPDAPEPPKYDKKLATKEIPPPPPRSK